jgi:hypothetical protein
MGKHNSTKLQTHSKPLRYNGNVPFRNPLHNRFHDSRSGSLPLMLAFAACTWKFCTKICTNLESYPEKKKINIYLVLLSHFNYHHSIFIPELGCVGEGDRQDSREYLCCTQGAPEFP